MEGRWVIRDYALVWEESGLEVIQGPKIPTASQSPPDLFFSKSLWNAS